MKETSYALLSSAAGDISEWYAHARHKLMIWSKENQARFIHFPWYSQGEIRKTPCVIFIVVCPPFAPHNTPFSQDGLRLSQLIMKVFHKLLCNSCRRLSQPRDKTFRSALYLGLVKQVVSKLRRALTAWWREHGKQRRSTFQEVY